MKSCFFLLTLLLNQVRSIDPYTKKKILFTKHIYNNAMTDLIIHKIFIFSQRF